MSDNENNESGNKPPETKPARKRRVRATVATNLSASDAKREMEKVREETYSPTQPAYRYSAQAPYFLNMIREMYREKDVQPKKLTPEVLEEVIERLWTGESLSAICQDDHVPAYKNLMKWLELHPDVEAMIDKAKMRGTHALVDVMMDIMNSGPMSTGDNSRDAELVKLIKWILGKRNSYYTENVKVTHEGEQRVFVLPSDILPGELIEDNSQSDTPDE